MKFSTDNLSHSLRSFRPPHLPEPATDFTSRVLDEVRLTPQEPASAFAPLRHAWWLAAAASVALVAAGILMRPDASETLPAGSIARVEAMLEWSPGMALATYDPVTYDPAAAELKALRRDGERALQFVQNQASALVSAVP